MAATARDGSDPGEETYRQWLKMFEDCRKTGWLHYDPYAHGVIYTCIKPDTDSPSGQESHQSRHNLEFNYIGQIDDVEVWCSPAEPAKSDEGEPVMERFCWFQRKVEGT